MSEYQWYEFVAVDRPLSKKEQAALRAISTRAEISATRFWNEYQWGDLKADPAKLLAKYFDLHLYFANWGSHRLMLRLPEDRVDLAALKPYFTGALQELTRHKGHVVLDLRSENDEGDYEEEFPTLSTLAPVRSLLLQGDLRPAYLAWLCGLQQGERDDESPEPPVPPGLGQLDASLEALVDFLRIDTDLLAAAVEASPPLDVDERGLESWVKALPETERLRWLLRALKHPEAALGAELRAAYLKARAPAAQPSRRTGAELWQLVEQKRVRREAREAAASARATAAAERKREKQLKELSARGAKAWTQLEQEVDARNYEKAIALAVDLHELAHRDGKEDDFEARFARLKTTQARRKGFFDGFKRAMRGE